MEKVEGKYILFASGVLAFLTLGFIYKRQIVEFGKDVILDYAFTKEQEHYLKDLHPKYVNVFRNFIADVEKNTPYRVLLTSGYRSFAEQDKLHKQNSSNAKMGASVHNYGVGIDLNLINKKDNSALRKSSSSADWEKTGVIKIASKYGLRWGGGGNFGNYHDPVHFEIPLSGDKLYAQAIKQFESASKVIGNRVNIT